MPELIKCHLGTVADPEDRAGGAGEGGQRAVPQAWVQRAKPPLGSLGGALRPPPQKVEYAYYCILRNGKSVFVNTKM